MRGEIAGESNTEPEVLITLDGLASEEEIQAIQSVFEQEGIYIRFNPTSYGIGGGRGDITQIPWLLIISAPTAIFLKRFAERAADDSYSAFKQLIIQLWSIRTRSTGPQGMIMLRNNVNDYDKSVIITPDLPDEAYADLPRAIALLEKGSLEYDRELGKWKLRGNTGEIVHSRGFLSRLVAALRILRSGSA